MMDRRNAVFLQCRRIADAGEHQQLRRLERAELKITSRRARIWRSCLPRRYSNADRAFALKQDTRGVRLRLDMKIVAAVHEGMGIAARGAPAFAVLLRHLVNADAFLLLAVKIVADRKL